MELEVHEFPWGIPGWVGIISGLLGLAFLGVGYSIGIGMLWLAISAIVTILGFIIGVEQIKDWGEDYNNYRERQEIRKQINRGAELGNTAKELQDNGDIPNNDRLREIGFTDNELREWELLK